MTTNEYRPAAMTPPRLDEGSEREAQPNVLEVLSQCLRWHQGDKFRYDEDEANCDAWEAHKHLLENTIAALSASKQEGKAEGWISVDDRLPTQNVEVLIAFRDSSLPATGQYTASRRDMWGWCFPSENDPDETGPITHWMPLPPAPAAQSQGGSNV